MSATKEMFIAMREAEEIESDYLDEDFYYQQWLNAEQPFISAKQNQLTNGNSNELQAHQSMGEGRQESPNL